MMATTGLYTISTLKLDSHQRSTQNHDRRRDRHASWNDFCAYLKVTEIINKLDKKLKLH